MSTATLIEINDRMPGWDFGLIYVDKRGDRCLRWFASQALQSFFETTDDRCTAIELRIRGEADT